SPASTAWTEYDVVDLDGKVTVSAHKSDVKIEARMTGLQSAKKAEAAGTVVHEGEQKTRDEHCGASPTRVGAGGPWLQSPWAKWGGLGAVAVVTCLALCHGDDPISPSNPSGK